MIMVAGAKENPVAIRFPKAVLVAVTEQARANGRSRNSEIIVRLATSLGLDQMKEAGFQKEKAA